MKSIFSILVPLLFFTNSVVIDDRATTREKKITVLQNEKKHVTIINQINNDTLKAFDNGYKKGQADKHCNVHYSDANITFKIVDGELYYSIARDTFLLSKKNLTGTGKVAIHTIGVK